MNQACQMDFIGKQPINMNPTVSQRSSGRCQEKEGGFSDFMKKLMAQSDITETETEKKPGSQAKTDEHAHLSEHTGFAILLPNLMVEQNTVPTDNMIREAMADAHGTAQEQTGNILANTTVVATEEESKQAKTESMASKTVPAELDSDLEVSAATQTGSRMRDGEVPEEISGLGKTASQESAKVNSGAEKENVTADGSKVSTDMGMKSRIGFGESGLSEGGEEALGQKTDTTSASKFETKGEKSEAKSVDSYKEAALGVKEETTGLKTELHPSIDLKTSTEVTGSTRANQVASSESDFAANMAEKAQLEEKVVKQIINGSRVMVKDGVARVEMHLEPKELGKLELSLTIDRDVVTAKFVAESKTVQAIIESNLNNLRTSLQDAGMKADLLQVGVQTGGSGHQEQTGSLFKQESHSAGTEVLAEETEEFQVAGSQDYTESQGWGRVDFRA